MQDLGSGFGKFMAAEHKPLELTILRRMMFSLDEVCVLGGVSLLQ